MGTKYAHINLEELAKDYEAKLTYTELCQKYGIQTTASLVTLLAKAGVKPDRGPGGRPGLARKRFLSVVPEELENSDPRAKLLEVAIPAYIQASPAIAKAVTDAMNGILTSLRMDPVDTEEIERLLDKMFGPA